MPEMVPPDSAPPGAARPSRRVALRAVLPLAVAIALLLTVAAALVAVGYAARQEEVLTRLLTLARRLEPEALENAAELRAHVRRWQVDREDEEAASGPPRLTSRPVYADVLRAADRLHQTLIRVAADRRARIARLELLEGALIALLAVLSLVSVLVLGRFGRRQAVLAAEAERRRIELERVSDEKARFIRGITHDLKNPLGAVDAYAQLLEAELKGGLTEEQRHYVGRIRSAVQQVLATIQDLLELARAESGVLPVERRVTRLAELVADLAEDYRAAFETSGLTLEVEARQDLPAVVTDERRVREILGNLLSNALKYTPAGGRVWVRAEVHLRGPREGEEWIAVAVQDTGPGIPADAQEGIFEEFRRLEAGTAAPGAGLGLAISRRMARLIGGELTVRSRPGEGATFTLWVPLQAHQALRSSGS